MFLLFPFKSGNVLDVAGEDLFSQLIRTLCETEVQLVNYLAVVAFSNLTFKMAQFETAAVLFKNRLEDLMSLLKVSRCNANLHCSEHLLRLEIFQNPKRQQHKDRKYERHVETTNAAGQPDAETDQKDRRLFWVPDVCAETN